MFKNFVVAASELSPLIMLTASAFGGAFDNAWLGLAIGGTLATLALGCARLQGEDV